MFDNITGPAAPSSMHGGRDIPDIDLRFSILLHSIVYAIIVPTRETRAISGSFYKIIQMAFFASRRFSAPF